MGYLSPRARTQFRNKVMELGRHRPVYWLFAESPTAAEALAGVQPPLSGGWAQHSLVLLDLTRDPVTANVLGYADPHGRWLRWVADSA